MLLWSVPPLPPVQATRLSVLGGMLRGAGTRFALLLTFLVVLAHFGTYTYVTPFLEQVTHAGDGTVTTFLLLYGAAGIVGNLLGGAWVARRPRTMFGLAAGLVAAVTLLLVWRLTYGAVPVASQTWFAGAAPHAPEAASVLFTASIATLAVMAVRTHPTTK